MCSKRLLIKTAQMIHLLLFMTIINNRANNCKSNSQFNKQNSNHIFFDKNHINKKGNSIWNNLKKKHPPNIISADLDLY